MIAMKTIGLSKRLAIKITKKWFDVDISEDLAKTIIEEVEKAAEENGYGEVSEGELCEIICEVLEDNELVV